MNKYKVSFITQGIQKNSYTIESKKLFCENDNAYVFYGENSEIIATFPVKEVYIINLNLLSN